MKNLQITRLLPCLAILILVCIGNTPAQNQLKVLSYNVLEGLQNDSAVQAEYIVWVKEIAPDIVGYQEMNGFTQRSLERFAARYGHPYAILSKVEGYPVALSSKYPILNVQKVVDNMWHAYIYANVNNIHVFVIHFSPWVYTKRQHEMRQILAHAALLPRNDKILIMGDFNSLDASDAPHHSADIVKKARDREAANPQIRNLNQGAIDYTVMALIRDAGFKDTWWLTNKETTGSIPTKKYGPPSMSRIDYIWANPAMARLVTSCTIVKDSTTDHISDHYPVLVGFEGR